MMMVRIATMCMGWNDARAIEFSTIVDWQEFCT